MTASASLPTSSALFVVLDMDNCWLAEVGVLEQIYGTYESLVANIQNDYTQLSLPIITNAIGKISQHNPQKVFVATGSSRQSLTNELLNAQQIVQQSGYEQSKGCRLKMARFSSYHALLLMVDILKILCPDRKVKLFEFCLADFLVTQHKCPQDISRTIGTTFNSFGKFYAEKTAICTNIIQDVERCLPDANPISLALDPNKIILMYFLIHVAYLLCGLQGAVFCVYDDSARIVDAMNQQYCGQTDLLPKGCVLHLQHYQSFQEFGLSPSIHKKFSIIGTGCCDLTPYETYHLLIQCCAAGESVHNIVAEWVSQGGFQRFIRDLMWHRNVSPPAREIPDISFLINVDTPLHEQLGEFARLDLMSQLNAVGVCHASILDWVQRIFEPYPLLPHLFRDICNKIELNQPKSVALIFVQSIEPQLVNALIRAIQTVFQRGEFIKRSFATDYMQAQLRVQPEKDLFLLPSDHVYPRVKEHSLVLPLAVYFWVQNFATSASLTNVYRQSMCYVYGTDQQKLQQCSKFYRRNHELLLPIAQSLQYCLLSDSAVIEDQRQIEGRGQPNPVASELFRCIQPPATGVYSYEARDFLQHWCAWHASQSSLAANLAAVRALSVPPDDWVEVVSSDGSTN